MNIKKRLPTSLAYLLLPVACLLPPVTCLAEYTYSTDGAEVTDTVTGLVWRRCSEGQTWSGSTCTGTPATYTHEGALTQAKNQALASGKAWRVPNVKELASITQLGVSINPSIDTAAFPATPSSYFWTSSPYVGSSYLAWLVDFSYGDLDNYYRGTHYYVRLVR